MSPNRQPDSGAGLSHTIAVVNNYLYGSEKLVAERFIELGLADAFGREADAIAERVQNTDPAEETITDKTVDGRINGALFEYLGYAQLTTVPEFAAMEIWGPDQTKDLLKKVYEDILMEQGQSAEHRGAHKRYRMSVGGEHVLLYMPDGMVFDGDRLAYFVEYKKFMIANAKNQAQARLITSFLSALGTSINWRYRTVLAEDMGKANVDINDPQVLYLLGSAGHKIVRTGVNKTTKTLGSRARFLGASIQTHHFNLLRDALLQDRADQSRAEA